MKTVISLILVVFVVTGCATLGPTSGNPASTGSTNTDAGSSTAAPTTAFPSQDQDFGPRLIIPATGGPPVIGIPVGGDLFLPVTGGPPVTGIPTSP
jgi:hypothetical protein